MNKYQRENKKAKWLFMRWFHDIAIYAVCSKCQYNYPCSKDVSDDEHPFKRVPDTPHNYCPNCGRKMGLYDADQRVHKIPQDCMEIEFEDLVKL